MEIAMPGRGLPRSLPLLVVALLACHMVGATDLSDATLFARKPVSEQLPLHHPRLTQTCGPDPASPEQVTTCRHLLLYAVLA